MSYFSFEMISNRFSLFRMRTSSFSGSRKSRLGSQQSSALAQGAGQGRKKSRKSIAKEVKEVKEAKESSSKEIRRKPSKKIYLNSTSEKGSPSKNKRALGKKPTLTKQRKAWQLSSLEKELLQELGRLSPEKSLGNSRWGESLATLEEEVFSDVGSFQLRGALKHLLEIGVIKERGSKSEFSGSSKKIIGKRPSRKEDQAKKDQSKIRFGLEKNYLVGKLDIHNSGAAHLILLAPGKDDLPMSKEHLGTGMQGDIVLVERFKKKEDPRSTSRRKFPQRGSKRELLQVITLLKRVREEFVGVLQACRGGFILVADDPELGYPIHLVEKIASDWPPIGNKVVARLLEWEDHTRPPEGILLRDLGKVDDPAVGMLSLLHKHRLPFEFPEAVLEQAARFGEEIDPNEIEGRYDFRHRPVITIDPADARDFDDAIEVEQLSEGWRVFIHIADVAHYVRPGSLLDREAHARGNSTYLVDRVIPMLPQVLSNGLCSLVPDQDRLTLSVMATVDRQGNVADVEFARSAIHSSARLTYEEALHYLEHPDQSLLSQHITTAWQCARVLREKRMAEGALSLEMPELKVHLDREGKPIRLQRITTDSSHQLIEELMLLANELVAKHLFEVRQAVLYRIHQKPDQLKLQDYRDLVLSYGIEIGRLEQPHQIEGLLRRIEGEPYAHVLKIALLRSMQKAAYAPSAVGHYGLQKKFYTHFTSPIRRYADLVVHRALLKVLGWSRTAVDSRTLGRVAQHLSDRERAAMDGERESVQMKKIEYFEILEKEDQKYVWEAHLVEVRRQGLFIEIPELLLSGFLPLEQLHDDHYIFDALNYQLIGRKHRQIYRAGDTLLVEVDRVDRWKQQVYFRLARACSKDL